MLREIIIWAIAVLLFLLVKWPILTAIAIIAGLTVFIKAILMLWNFLAGKLSA